MPRVGDLIKRAPVSVKPNATLRDVARILTENNIGIVVVVDDTGKPLGVVSERDIVKALAKGASLDDRALDYGTRGNLLTISRDGEPQEAIKRMRDRGTRHILVLNPDGSLAGVLSIRDLLEDQVLKVVGDRYWKI